MAKRLTKANIELIKTVSDPFLKEFTALLKKHNLDQFAVNIKYGPRDIIDCPNPVMVTRKGKQCLKCPGDLTDCP